MHVGIILIFAVTNRNTIVLIIDTWPNSARMASYFTYARCSTFSALLLKVMLYIYLIIFIKMSTILPTLPPVGGRVAEGCETYFI